MLFRSANKALGAKITTPMLDITGEGILSQEISGGALILSPKTLMKVAGVFILASFALIIVLGAGYLEAQPTLSGRKIRSLSRESGEIDQMIVDLEKKRYIEKTLGAAEFAERKGRLQERKLKIAQEITTMQSKLKTKKNNNGNNVKRGLRDLE